MVKGDKDNDLWLDLWNDKDSSFHQSEVNRFLVKLWPDLLPRQRHTVFVPFCGKSQDMLWLSSKGYQVLGVELSSVAVEAFFKENRLKAAQKKLGSFVRWRSGNITVLCGDYFQLERRMLGKVSSIYDCAALAALADDVRPLYVAHMRHLIDANIEILLLSIEDDARGSEDPPLPDVELEVAALYGASCNVHLCWQEQMASDDPQRSVEQGTGSTYKVYRIEAHWGADDALPRHSLA